MKGKGSVSAGVWNAGGVPETVRRYFFAFFFVDGIPDKRMKMKRGVFFGNRIRCYTRSAVRDTMIMNDVSYLDIFRKAVTRGKALFIWMQMRMRRLSAKNRKRRKQNES